MIGGRGTDVFFHFCNFFLKSKKAELENSALKNIKKLL